MASTQASAGGWAVGGRVAAVRRKSGGTVFLSHTPVDRFPALRGDKRKLPRSGYPQRTCALPYPLIEENLLHAYSLMQLPGNG